MCFLYMKGKTIAFCYITCLGLRFTGLIGDTFCLLNEREFVLEAPLRPSTALNYQAATRFIEHSLPDLTAGR